MIKEDKPLFNYIWKAFVQRARAKEGKIGKKDMMGKINRL